MNGQAATTRCLECDDLIGGEEEDYCPTCKNQTLSLLSLILTSITLLTVFFGALTESYAVKVIAVLVLSGYVVKLGHVQKSSRGDTGILSRSNCLRLGFTLFIATPWQMYWHFIDYCGLVGFWGLSDWEHAIVFLPVNLLAFFLVEKVIIWFAFKLERLICELAIETRKLQ